MGALLCTLLILFLMFRVPLFTMTHQNITNTSIINKAAHFAYLCLAFFTLCVGVIVALFPKSATLKKNAKVVPRAAKSKSTILS